MPILHSNQIPDILDSRPLEIFFLTNEQNPKSYPQLFRTKSITRAFEDNLRFSGVGRFITKPEGQAVQYDTPVQGQRTRTTVGTYALGVQMSMEAQMDAQFDVLDRQVEGLTRSQIDHEERLAWGAVGDMFDGLSTGVGLDGLSVVSTAHPLLKPPTPAITTQSNELSPGAPLDITSLEAALILGETQLSEEGHQIGQSYRYRYLVVPSTLMHVAWTLLNTTKRPGGDLNDSNTLTKYNMTPLSSPYLNDIDTSDWSIQSEAGRNGWVFYSRMKPTFSRSIDSETGNRKIRQMYRANVAHVSPLGGGIIGSQN